MMDWGAHKAHREAVMAQHGQWVGVLDRDWQPVVDVDEWLSAAQWPGVFGDTGSMQMTVPGFLADGSRNPVVDYLLFSDLSNLDDPASMEKVFHTAVHIAVERPGLKRRTFRILDLVPEGGDEWPRQLGITGMSDVEHVKHVPAWADPSNRSKIVQWQFSDIQQGSAEVVSRKILGRNLLGYQQPSLLSSSTAWTDDYSSPARWSNVNPNLHAVICSPIPSGLPSEWCVVEARWDNTWDLLKATWEAAGILPVAWLWFPGDPQPFPAHTVLSLPTTIIDFRPRSTVTGAAGLLDQGWAQIRRIINMDDKFTSVLAFDQAPVPTADGRAPWVVFDLPEAPKMVVRKSTDHTFLVGGQSPKGLNDLLEVGIKTVVAAIVASIPIIGPAAAAIINGGAELLGRLAADRFLNLNEFTDQARRSYHGRSGYLSVAKTGHANSFEALQKAWQAKTETAGSLSVEFVIDDPGPYVPGRDFDLGDVAGVRCWGVIWAAYVSELSWTSEPGRPVGWKVTLGNFSALLDPEALLAANAGTVRSIIGRLATLVQS